MVHWLLWPLQHYVLCFSFYLKYFLSGRVGHWSGLAGFGPEIPSRPTTDEHKLPPIPVRFPCRFCRVSDVLVRRFARVGWINYRSQQRRLIQINIEKNRRTDWQQGACFFSVFLFYKILVFFSLVVVSSGINVSYYYNKIMCENFILFY